jgi:hypothetical protein
MARAITTTNLIPVDERPTIVIEPYEHGKYEGKWAVWLDPSGVPSASTPLRQRQRKLGTKRRGSCQSGQEPSPP